MIMALTKIKKKGLSNFKNAKIKNPSNETRRNLGVISLEMESQEFSINVYPRAASWDFQVFVFLHIIFSDDCGNTNID